MHALQSWLQHYSDWINKVQKQLESYSNFFRKSVEKNVNMSFFTILLWYYFSLEAVLQGIAKSPIAKQINAEIEATLKHAPAWKLTEEKMQSFSLQIPNIDLNYKLQLLASEYVFLFCYFPILLRYRIKLNVILILKYLAQQTNTCKMWSLLKVNSKECVSLSITSNTSKTLFKCFSGLLWTFICLLWCFYFYDFFLMILLSILNRFHAVIYLFCYQR